MPRKRYRAVILVMLACSILCALGVWQLKRLAWKESLVATLEQRLKESPVDFADLSEPRSEQEWTPVRISGEFVTGKHFMISPRTMNGQVGMHLIDVIMLSDGTTVAVNRGFVAMKTPELTETFDPPPEGSVTIDGVVRVPSRGDFTPENNPERAEWYWADVATMLRGEQKPVTDIYIQQTATSSTAGYPMPLIVTPELPNNHAQYAAFWFGMAGLCLLIFALARKKGYA